MAIRVGKIKTTKEPKDPPLSVTILDTFDLVAAIIPTNEQYPIDTMRLFRLVYFILRALKIIGFIGLILNPPKIIKDASKTNLPTIMK
jgi:hypothetical protein